MASPIARDDIWTIAFGSYVMGNLFSDNGNGVDFDPDGDTINVVETKIITAQGGLVRIFADGSFIYRPPFDVTSAVDSFTYTVSDGNGGTSTAVATVNVSALSSTINGGSNGTTINGTENDDVILAQAGADIVNANGGNDTVYGGSGNDTLNGGNGDDVLHGDGGNDVINGGDGVDTAAYNFLSSGFIIFRDNAGYITVRDMFDTGLAGFGIDRVSNDVEFVSFADLTLNVASLNLVLNGAGWGVVNFTGDANANNIAGTVAQDIVYAGAGNDSINTLQGNDTIYGEDGNDIINAGDGDDSVYGGVGADTIRTEAGDDTIFGGAGSDLIYGGLGSDTAVYTMNSAGFIIYRDNAAYFTVRDMNDVSVNGQGMDRYYNDVEFIEFNNVTVDIASLNLVLNGAGWGTAPIVNGDDNGNLLSGTLANDVIYGRGGNDTINLVAGDDTAYGELGNDILNGGDGDDYLDGGDGSDRLNGDAGNDSLYGGLANDTMTGGLGNDTLSGDEGNDTLTGDDGNDFIDGGADRDTVNYLTATAGVAVNLGLTTAQNTVGAGFDRILNVENINGSNFNDSLTGNNEANTINGFAGDDTISGGDGNDVLFGGDGNDSLLGGEGDDNLRGDVGDDTLNGGNGFDLAFYNTATAGVTIDLNVQGVAQNTVGAGLDTLINVEGVLGTNFADTLSGTANNDWLSGGGGNDILSAGAGDDFLDGGNDNDVLDGGAGDDTLQGGRGDDVITGGAGSDTAVYTLVTGAVTVDLTLQGTSQNTGSVGLDTLTGIENLIGSSFNDTLSGDSADNIIDGGVGGDDLLTGGGGIDTVSYASASAGVTLDLTLQGAAQNTVNSGLDTLTGFSNIRGSAFNDTLSGDNANNVIDGGAGDDVLNGGGGNDTVSYASASAGVTVNLGLTVAQNTVNSGFDTLTGFSNIRGSAFNDTLTGDNGDNLLEGGLGDDVLNGGGGNDTVSYANATSAITLNLGLTTAQNTGGAGIDTVSGIENVIATAFDDTITLGASGGTINGGGGNDTVVLSGNWRDYTISFDAIAGVYTAVQGASTYVLSNFDRYQFADQTITPSTPQDLLNDAPTDLAASNTDLAFDALAGDVVANFTVTDIDINDAHNFVISGGAHAALFQIVGNQLRVAAGGLGSVIPGDQLSVEIEVTDAAGVSYRETFVINVFDPTPGSLIEGDANDNILVGTDGPDQIFGYGGNDTLTGGLDNDTLDGGIGIDTASYSTATAGVTVNLTLTAAQDTLGAGVDTLISIENLTGSAFNDSLSGSGVNNALFGGDGNDTIFADLGNDTMDGGDGIDTVSFATATLGTRANLTLTAGQTTNLGGDIIRNFENIIGSDFNDTYTGSAGDNVIDGGLGNDTIQGGDGNDSLIGGSGVDLLTYANAGAGVTVNLTLATAQNTLGAGIDTLSGFENITGSAFADNLTGTGDDNIIFGGLSDDIIFGLGGNDNLNGDDGNDIIYGGAGNNIMNGGNGLDIIYGGDGVNTINAGAGNDTIYGGLGVDNIIGGSGTDIVRYDSDTVGMTISIGSGGGTTGLSANDTYNTVEGIYGGSGNDVISGNNSANIFYGLGGNDSLNGGGGNDTLAGGLGTDTLTGGSGRDTLIFDNLSNVDVVTDFSRTQGDILFLDDIITGFTPGVSNINEFVLFSISGSNTNVFVDTNGTVGGTAWTQIATLNNITTLNVTTMFGNGTLIID